MVQRQKVHCIFSNPIYNAIAANNDLSNVFDAQLRNNPPQAWMARQPVCRTEYAVGEYRRQRRSVSGNEQTNCLQIVGRLTAPSYFSHFAMRLRTYS